MSYDIIYNNSLAIALVFLVFTLIVFFHELGHFLVAKLFGVKVEEFGIGIPPKIMNLFEDKSGTVYTINLLPIGGFVSLKGEKMDDLQYYEKDSLLSKNIFKQILIILAGVFMNFLLAISIFSFLFYYGVQPLAINTKFETSIKTKLIPNLEDAVKDGLLKTEGIIISPIKDSVASLAGLKDKDIVVAINSVQISKPEEMVNMIKYITTPLSIKILRDKKEQIIVVTPKEGKIGSYIGYNITEKNSNFQYKSNSIKEAIGDGYYESLNQTKMILELLRSTFSKLVFPKNPYERTEATESIGGPISIGSMFIDLVNQKAGVIVFAMVAALLSLNLGVFNLLPLPALDGGRFFILLVNGVVSIIFGKKAINEKTEKMIHIIGFTLLIGLSILVAYLDIFKIFHK